MRVEQGSSFMCERQVIDPLTGPHFRARILARQGCGLNSTLRQNRVIARSLSRLRFREMGDPPYQW